MKLIELKFLLKLLGKPDYRAAIVDLGPSEKISASDRNKICVDLTARGIVAYLREVKQFKLNSAGKTLLNQDTAQLPLSELQIAILKACESKSAKPGELKKIPMDDRQTLIQDLAEKGLIKIEKEQIKEVWLTELGQEYLIQELALSGNSTISLNLFGNYIQFIRKIAQANSIKTGGRTEQSITTAPLENHIALPLAHRLNDEEILQIILDLDREFNTDNYLPIFHLRQKLASLSREELDQMLYQLQRQDKIELSTLQEGHRYTHEQIEAGIRQPVGGPLFFIVVV